MHHSSARRFFGAVVAPAARRRAGAVVTPAARRRAGAVVAPTSRWLTGAVLALLSVTTTPAAEAAEYWLYAGPTTVTMPDGATVPMWGFALEADQDFTTLEGTPTVPGPPLTLAPGDTSLTLRLYNALPAEPVSIVIPGQLAALEPVMFTDATGRQRVRSFTREAAPGAVETYAWTGLRSGTYLYHSGTHPQVQVQMGLYGALELDAAAGAAYPGVAYDAQLTLLYSEIDPALHAAVDDGSYGTAAFPSTFEYHPRYFLVNGQPWSTGSSPVPVGQVNDRILLRLLNAGLMSHVPALIGGRLEVVAEDGNLYPYRRDALAPLLPAGKTLDALLVPAAPGTYRVFDRMLSLTNGAASDGGMLTLLEVADANERPIGTSEAYSVDASSVLEVAAPGVLANDIDPDGDALTASLVVTTAHGGLSLEPDGAFRYEPAPGYAGSDGFTYVADDGLLTSEPVTVSIEVVPENHVPAAAGDAYAVKAGQSLVVPAPGVLGNDTDADGDALTAVLDAGPTGGALSLQPDGGFTYTPAAATQSDSFSYRASDGIAESAAATVTITVNQNQPPTATSDTATVHRNTPTTIDVLANDQDPDGTLVPGSVTIGTPARRGTAVANPDGTVQYTPQLNFRGTDMFTYTVRDNDGALSNAATVRVNVVR